MSKQIIDRHFSRATLRALSRRGVEVLGPIFVPGPSGGYLDGSTAYTVSDSGTSRILSLLELLTLANTKRAA